MISAEDAPYPNNRMRRILTVKNKSDFYLENQYAAINKLNAPYVLIINKSIIFIKIRCVVLAEANVSYLRYVSK